MPWWITDPLRGLLMAACLFFSANLMAQASTPEDVPLRLPKGFVLPLGNSSEVLWVVGNLGVNKDGPNFDYIQRWNPATGGLKKLTPPRNTSLHSAVATSQGVFFVGNPYPGEAASGSIVLLTPQNKAITATLQVWRERPRVLVLADQSVLVVGGILEWEKGNIKSRTNAVERISFIKGKLVVERLPDLPGVVRTSYSLVALSDGRAMALGGTDSRFIGCSPCIADTYVLDTKTKIWSEGPKMTEPRADATATLLPDGGVLVAGGWTPGHGEGGWGVASRSTERWESRSNRFKAGAPMPMGVAMHKAVWISTQQGKQLLVAGGNSAVVQAYDVAGDNWKVVGELCATHERGADIVLPFEYNNHPYLWIKSDEVCSCRGSQSDYESVARSCSNLLSLRLSSPGATGGQRFDPQVGFLTYRTDFQFVPGQGNEPSYVVGGRVDGKDPNKLDDALAIWPDGRIEAVSPKDVKYPLQEFPPLPPQNRERMSSYDTSHGGKEEVVTKLVAGGRVIVAGGNVQVHKIALLTESALKGDEPDEYDGIGEYLPSRRHEIFEPATEAWRNSDPSSGAGGPVAIFDDGRVVKMGRIAERSSKKIEGADVFQPDQYILEISSADGNSWHGLEVVEPPLVQFTYVARPFVIQDELFLSGQLAPARTGGGPDAVQWFNASTRRWETLWEAGPKDNWRDHVGRIIIRDLANGKRVVLPVAGL